ncbi:(2Fe-2S)-binding protein, partial [Variovorax sp. CT11-76]
QCCLYHLLPGEEHCGACPLAPRHREAGAAEA